jgi:hypothetical protein
MDNTFVRSVINSNNLISAPSYFCWKCQLTDKSPICSGYYKISTSSLFCLEAQFEGRFYIIYRCYTNCMKWRDFAFCFFCIQLKFAPRVLILLRQFLHSILLVRERNIRDAIVIHGVHESQILTHSEKDSIETTCFFS